MTTDFPKTLAAEAYTTDIGHTLISTGLRYEVVIERITPTAKVPVLATAGAAARDVFADNLDPISIPSLGRALIPTGLRIKIPMHCELQVRARSGLALKEGICLANGVGTIDSDYSGELGIILLNTSDRAYTVHHGDRIAQILIAPVLQMPWVEGSVTETTTRGSGGFGSTGR